MQSDGMKGNGPARRKGEEPVSPEAFLKDQVEALVALYRRGDLEAVVQRCGALAERFPQAIVLHNLLGAANAGLRRYDAAIESYRQALRIKPDYAEAHNNIGAALKAKGELTAAIESYERAIRIRPDYATAHNNLGAALKDRGDVTGAIASYGRAVELRPDYAEAHSNLGNALLGAGDVAAAVASHERAIALRPDYAAAHSNLGNALREKGDLAAAIASHERAVRLRPDFAEAHYNLGTALKEKGDLSGAIRSYRRAIEIRPDFAEAHNGLGTALREKGDLSGAMQSYGNAMRIDPDDADANYNTGNVLQEQSEFLAAIERYERVLRVRPDDPEVHYNIGSSYRAISRHKEALSHFRHSDYRFSESFELECLYMLGEEKAFLEKNLQLFNKNTINAVMGALGSHAEIRFGTEVPNSFCHSPLDYIYSSRAGEPKAFFDGLIEQIRQVSRDAREQSLLVNGLQTAGNFFSIKNPIVQQAEALIQAKIDEYRKVFAQSNQPFITHFPESYSLNGWVLNMKSNGYVKSHIHEFSWISGTLYIKVPKKREGNEGNIMFSTHGGFYPETGKAFPEKIVEVAEGVVNLFPASLFHETIPFASDEERICLAFDLRPA